jgi:hypothetical protein
MDMRFGIWNVRNLNMVCSLKTAAGIKSKYKLDLVGVQEVRWDKGGIEPAIMHFSTEIGIKSCIRARTLTQGNHISSSGVKKVKCVGDRMFYVTLGYLCDIVLLNVIGLRVP